MSRWTVSSAPPFCTGEPLRLIDRLEQWIFRSVLHDIGGNTKWSYRGELQLRIESKTLSKAQSVPSAPLRTRIPVFIDLNLLSTNVFGPLDTDQHWRKWSTQVGQMCGGNQGLRGCS
jgi:hypothetical protein